MKFNEIKELDSHCYMQVYKRQPAAIVSGKGCKLYDAEGRELTDFFAGIAVNALGYADPELSQAIADQALKLLHASNHFYTEEQSEVSALLLKDSDFTRVFICNSGTEANEGAIKLIRRYFHDKGGKGGKKSTILTAVNSFHGRTFAAMTATGQPKYSLQFSPLVGGFKHISFNDIESFRFALSEDVGAVILETIQGEGGVRAASKEYLAEVSRICKEKDILLVIDEVQTGIGRTGKMFGYEHYGIKPDIITLAKALGGGVPIGAVLARGDVATAFAPGDHGTTFGGNALACRAAIVVLNRLKNTDLLKQVEENGKYLEDKLRDLAKRSSHVAEVRGMGLLLGMELKSDFSGADIVGKMLEKGYIINCCGNNTLRFCPPLIISRKEIDEMIETLTSLLV